MRSAREIQSVLVPEEQSMAGPKRIVAICTSLGIYGPAFFPKEGGREYASTPYLDMLKATREVVAKAIQGGPPFPIPPEEIIHGASVSEAVIRSASSGQVEKIS